MEIIMNAPNVCPICGQPREELRGCHICQTSIFFELEEKPSILIGFNCRKSMAV